MGTGPGAITPDGCAVELYLRLPVGKEPEVIAASVPSGASILELGCGTGRVTHPLVEGGFAVTAVDESAEMLSHVSGARTVQSPIETLDLGERFDVVLLGSFLVHGLEAAGLLDACVRHVKPDGVVLMQREGVDWHDKVPREKAFDDGVVKVVSSTETSPGVRSVHVEYVFADAHWTQTFLSRPLSDNEFDGMLARAGLRLESYLTEDRTWVRAVPSE